MLMYDGWILVDVDCEFSDVYSLIDEYILEISSFGRCHEPILIITDFILVLKELECVLTTEDVRFILGNFELLKYAERNSLISEYYHFLHDMRSAFKESGNIPSGDDALSIKYRYIKLFPDLDCSKNKFQVYIMHKGSDRKRFDFQIEAIDLVDAEQKVRQYLNLNMWSIAAIYQVQDWEPEKEEFEDDH